MRKAPPTVIAQSANAALSKVQRAHVCGCCVLGGNWITFSKLFALALSTRMYRWCVFYLEKNKDDKRRRLNRWTAYGVHGIVPLKTHNNQRATGVSTRS